MQESAKSPAGIGPGIWVRVKAPGAKVGLVRQSRQGDGGWEHRIQYWVENANYWLADFKLEIVNPTQDEMDEVNRSYRDDNSGSENSPYFG